MNRSVSTASSDTDTTVLRLATLEKHLLPVTVGYLSLPLVIFFAGWTRLPVAGGCIALLVAAAWSYVGRGWPKTGGSKGERVRIGALLLGGVLVALLVSISGSGGWGYQDPIDWEKHNAILHDLIYNPWPVVYDVPTEPLAMVYYIAYYLPAAVVGKLLGWQAANHALFFTTFFGAILAYLWVVVLTRAHPVLCSVLFLGFSGMDVLGNLFFNAPRWDHLEWWSLEFARFNSSTTLLFWVPNQALGGWLLTALTLRADGCNDLPRVCLLLLALSGLWSPFIGVGLLLFTAGLLIAGYLDGRFALSETITLRNATGLLLGGVLLSYYLARYQPYTLPASIAELPVGGFALNVYRDGFAGRYLLFVLLEFAVLCTLVFACRRNFGSREHRFFWIAVLVLVALPFFRYGSANDLAMRASIPALFAVLTLTIQVVHHVRRRMLKAPLATLMVFVLLVSSLTPVVEVFRHSHQMYCRNDFITFPEQQSVKSIWELQKKGDFGRDEFNFVGQYAGSVDSFFANHLARRSLGGEQFRCSHASAEEE